MQNGQRLKWAHFSWSIFETLHTSENGLSFIYVGVVEAAKEEFWH